MRTKIENTHDPTPETVISLIWDETWLWCVSEGCVEKTTVRRSYLPLPLASVCLLVYLSKKESVAWGLCHPSLPFFLSPEGLVLFYCSLRFSQIQVRRGSCFGEVRAGVREMSGSLCAGALSKFSGQVLFITFFQEGTLMRGLGGDKEHQPRVQTFGSA